MRCGSRLTPSKSGLFEGIVIASRELDRDTGAGRGNSGAT
jgi:hypothetical protein